MRTPITAIWRRFLAAAVFAGVAFALGGCGSGGDSGTAASSVAVPGMPTNFTVVKTQSQTLSATLNWSAPASGGAPATYEIYRSTTGGSVFQPANHLITVSAGAWQTNYEFVDNAGLTAVNTYWVVSAKNAGGETPTAEFMYRPVGGPGVGDTGYGNNFSAALVFADDIGISGLALDLAKTWTNDLTQIDLNTGLRPVEAEVTALAARTPPVTTLPYLDLSTIYRLDGTDYYKQQTVSTWQGQWLAGASENQHVDATWGDNLASQSLTVNSVVRIEMVLSRTLTAPVISYNMKSLYGTMENEIQGTDGNTFYNSSAFVFASNAHLKIQKLDDSGNPDGSPLYDQTLWTGDGPGHFAAEVNVAGNFTYGFVWDLKNQIMPGDVTTGKAGTYRITFSLDPASPKDATRLNNTFIDSVSAPSVLAPNHLEAYIDINVAP